MTFHDSSNFNSQHCDMFDKLYVCDCLFTVGIRSNNWKFNRFMDQRSGNSGDCSWWTNNRYHGFDPYENINFINNFIQSHMNCDQFIYIESKKGFGHNESQNIFIDVTIENQRKRRIEKERIEREKKKVTFKVLHRNDDEWQNDKYRRRCGECFKEFTFFNRKHHCRCCGNVFCGDCTGICLFEQDGHDKKARIRVCKECNDKGWKYC